MGRKSRERKLTVANGVGVRREENANEGEDSLFQGKATTGDITSGSEASTIRVSAKEDEEEEEEEDEDDDDDEDDEEKSVDDDEEIVEEELKPNEISVPKFKDKSLGINCRLITKFAGNRKTTPFPNSCSTITCPCLRDASVVRPVANRPGLLSSSEGHSREKGER
jgi:hypothetical protein